MDPTAETDLTRRIIGCAIEVHRTLGPGLMEVVYETCLCHELARTGLKFDRQKAIGIVYKETRLDLDFRADIIVEDAVLLEIKAVQAIVPVHEAQLLTYLRLTRLPIGLLLNFNVPVLREGVRRRRL